MRQLQNDPEKIRFSTKSHRSNMPPDSAFTYGLINTRGFEAVSALFRCAPIEQRFSPAEFRRALNRSGRFRNLRFLVCSAAMS